MVITNIANIMPTHGCERNLLETKLKNIRWDKFHNSKEPNRNILYGAVIGGPDELQGWV